MAFVAAALAIAFASPAIAKTIRHSGNHGVVHPQFYNSAVVSPTAGGQLDDPYYAPYYDHSAPEGGFVVGGFH
jgi:hypothetical protein